MKTVIRIEHPSDGKGIWRSKGNNEKAIWEDFSFINELESKHEDFPTPYAEKLLTFTDSSYFCAFKSIEQINQWIEKEWWKEIISFGFKIYMIDLSEYLEGEYQICYQKQYILQQKDITSLFL